MSTQLPVRPAAFTALDAVKLAFAFSAWLLAAIGVGFLAYLAGGDAQSLAGATALALSPALAGLILLPWLHSRWAAVALLAAWLLAAMGLVAGGGGALSPLVCVFAALPVLSRAIGRRWAAESGAMAVLAYAVASGFALLEQRPAALLGAFPEMLSVAALAFLAALLAMDTKTETNPAREQALARRIAEVSHELRTPLTHILGFAELIERQISGPINERYIEYAGLIRRSGSQLLELVNDQLDASRIDAGRYELDFEVFDARAIIEEVTRMSADLAERKRIALAAWAPDTPLMVRADVNALRRMLINILGNALKFTPEGGRVVIAARAEGQNLVLEAIDNGPGINPQERARLGQAFERGASGARVEGTGLGLSLVRALAELHGGKLSFHDAPGGGALVRIEAPVMTG